MRLKHVIMASVRPGEESGYVAECLEVPIVTQGATLDETVRNLKEAADLYLDGEDRVSLGLAPNPTVVVTIEIETAYLA